MYTLVLGILHALPLSLCPGNEVVTPPSFVLELLLWLVQEEGSVEEWGGRRVRLWYSQPPFIHRGYISRPSVDA